MIDHVEQLTTDKNQTLTGPRDVNEVLNQLPVREQERNILLDSVTGKDADAAYSGTQRVGVWIAYAAVIGVATGLAALLMWMMGR